MLILYTHHLILRLLYLCGCYNNCHLIHTYNSDTHSSFLKVHHNIDNLFVASEISVVADPARPHQFFSAVMVLKPDADKNAGNTFDELQKIAEGLEDSREIKGLS